MVGIKKTQPWDMIGAYPICRSCGSENITRNAQASWSMSQQHWQLKTVSDDFACVNCGENTAPGWLLNEGFRRHCIQKLNDSVRQGKTSDATVVVTKGVQAEGEVFVLAAIQAMALFDDFTEDNDPYGEHDFGSFEIDGQKLFFKFDYYDPDLEGHSHDAADPVCTIRVLTLMLPSEY